MYLSFFIKSTTLKHVHHQKIVTSMLRIKGTSQEVLMAFKTFARKNDQIRGLGSFFGKCICKNRQTQKKAASMQKTVIWLDRLLNVPVNNEIERKLIYTVAFAFQ